MQIFSFPKCRENISEKMAASKIASVYELHIYEIFKNSMRQMIGQAH